MPFTSREGEGTCSLKPFPYGNRKHGKNSVLRHSPAAPMLAWKGKAQDPSSLLGAGGRSCAARLALLNTQHQQGSPTALRHRKRRRNGDQGRKMRKFSAEKELQLLKSLTKSTT